MYRQQSSGEKKTILKYHKQDPKEGNIDVNKVCAIFEMPIEQSTIKQY